METKGLKILAIDDIYDNLITIKALILETFSDAQVLFAQNGRDGIELAERVNPDILLLDVVMPEMDGFEVCRYFKSNEKLMDIPIVFITALKSDKDARIKGLEVGAEAFLSKPIDESELVAQIKAMSRIRQANKINRTEQNRLSNIVSEKTLQLELNSVATLNLLEDLQKEVDARRKTESELLKSEARLRRAELASKSGNWEYDPYKQTFILSVGAQFLLGFNDTEVAYFDFLNLFLENDKLLLISSLENLNFNNIPFNYELQLLPNSTNESIYVRIFAIKENEDSKIFGVIRNITDAHIAHIKLEESESLYRAVLEYSPDNVLITNPEGVIEHLSPFVNKTLGYSTPEELVGKNIISLIQPNELTRFIKEFDLEYLETPDKIFAFKCVRKDGSLIDVEAKRGIIANAENKTQKIIIVARDVTERKLEEERIRKSEAEFRSVWENSVNALRLTDENGVIIRANKSFCNLFSINEVDVVGKLMSDLYSRENEENELDKYKYKFAHGIHDRNREKEIILWNNDKKWVEIDKTYIEFDKESRLLLTIFNEITERKTAQIELAESEAKFRELMYNSPEGITIYVDGLIVYANKEAVNSMRAVSKDELIGKSLFEFIHPDNVELIMERMKFVSVTPLNMALPSVEEKYIRLDGTEMEVEIKVMPILYEGKPAVQITGSDITEKKQARLELERSRKELKTIYDNAPVMMCVVDEDTRILFANEALTTFIDQPNDLVDGTVVCGNVLDCIHSYDKPKGCGHGKHCNTCVLRNAIIDTFKTGIEHKDIDYHTTIVKNNFKKEVVLLAYTSLIQQGDDKRLLLCMIDITARKEAEIERAKSEMLLRTFVDNMPFGVWARDLQNRIIIQNQRLVNNFGNIANTDIADFNEIDTETAEKWDKTNKKAYAGEIINEETYYNVNGVPTPFQNIVFPIKTDTKIFGIAGINIEIAERINAQKELLAYQVQLKDFAAHLQTVREEERINLAREIHDDLGQVLVAIKFDLGMLGLKAKKIVRDESVEEFTKQFKRLELYVNNSIKSARRIMTDLRPELLDMVGLVEAFREHINAYNERQSIVCEFINKTDGVDLSPEKAVALFRILQESFNNASKHSEATSITVELGQINNVTYLEIYDNGVGFDMSLKKRNDSYGLVGMKERAYLLEGNVDIWSEPGKGVKIRVEVPD